MRINDVVETDKLPRDLHLLHGLPNVVLAHERLPGVAFARLHELFSSSFNLLEPQIVFLRLLQQLQSVELVHSLYTGAVLQSSDLVELVLQFLPSDLLLPLLPDLRANGLKLDKETTHESSQGREGASTPQNAEIARRRNIFPFLFYDQLFFVFARPLWTPHIEYVPGPPPGP